MNISEFFPTPKKPKQKTLEEKLHEEFNDFSKPTPPPKKRKANRVKPVDLFTERLKREFNLFEDGKIVKDVNTTDDVGLDEIKIQEKKMGFEVTRDGIPAYLDTHGKSYKPIVESNLIFHTKELKKNEIKNYIKEVYEQYNINKPFTSSISNVKYLNESTSDIKSYIEYFNSLGLPDSHTIKIGDYFSVLAFEFIMLHNEIEALGFSKPKEIVDIKKFPDGKINYIKFSDGDRYPRVTPATYNGQNVLQVAYFNNKKEVNNAITMLQLKLPTDWHIDFGAFNQNLHNITESNITKQDINDVAEWLGTTPDRVEMRIVEEPIEKFLPQIKEMYSTYEEYPQDAERTNKILKLLKAGKEPLPIYVEVDDNHKFVMEGRHRMVAFWLAGLKHIPVAYVKKKELKESFFNKQRTINTNHPIPGFDYDPLLFTDKNNVFDVGKLYEAYGFYLNHTKKKSKLNESTRKEFTDLTSLLSGISNPKIGNKYSVMMITRLSQSDITIDGHKTPHTLVNIIGNQYVFDINGNKERYPKKTSGVMLFETMLYDTKEALEKDLTYLTLKDRRIINHLIESEELTEIKMGPRSLQKQVDKIYDRYIPIVGFEMEICYRTNGENLHADAEITKYTTLDDLKEFFDLTDDEEFRSLSNSYANWVRKKSPEYYNNWDNEDIIFLNGGDNKDLSFGSYLLDNHYNTFMDLYYDNSDWLYFSDEKDEGSSFNKHVAEQVAELLDDYSIDAIVEDTYHSGKRPADKWVIEPDDSIEPEDADDVGMELISPPQDYNDGLLQFQDVCSMFESNGFYANESTGLHINVSVDGINIDDVNYGKLILLVGDSKVLQDFDREMNTYTEHALSAISKNLAPGKLMTKLDIADLLEKLDKLREGANKTGEKLITSGYSNGYVSVKLKNGYVEFRSVGGIDYFKYPEQIINTVNRFIVAYVASASPQKAQKEYAKKLYKLLSQHVPATQGAGLSDNALQLFTMRNTGMITDTQLKEKLKELNVQRNDIKNVRTVDEMIKAGAKVLALKYPNISEEELIDRIRLAYKFVEKNAGISNNEALKRIIDNLSNDIDFYEKMSKDDITRYLNS